MNRRFWLACVFAVFVVATWSNVAVAAPASRIAAGGYHTCAVTDAGAVWCWGRNDSGQLGDGTHVVRAGAVAVGSLGSGVVAMAAGWEHTCAVTNGGAVWCWGDNGYGQLGDGTNTSRLNPVAVTGLPGNVIAITAGYGHNCALTGAGAVWCWGANYLGQLGDGTTTSRSTPVAITAIGATVSAVGAGNTHTCAVTTAGAVWCWGGNDFYQLGDGTTTTRSTPAAVSGVGAGITSIAGGYYHTCAAASAGEVWCWGYNAYGEVGDGTGYPRSTPVSIGTLPGGVTSLTAGHRHACAVASQVWCWGHDDRGQVGDGATTDRLAPVAISGLAGGTAVAAGLEHTCAVTSTGAVKCFGSDEYGQLGDQTVLASLTAAPVVGLQSGASVVDSGTNHACAIGSGGGLLCWGDNFFGELGNGSTTTRSTPAAVSGMGSGVTAVSSGGEYTCAVAGGGAYCWGAGSSGQLGIGYATNEHLPVAVSGMGSGVAGISAGNIHTCAVTTGGAAWCWGRNDYGELGDGTTTNRLAPVAVGGLTGVVAVAVGDWHTCALTDVGAVSCWGANWDGALGDGTTTHRSGPVGVTGLGSGVVAIASGGYFSCALTSGGAVKCWGSNSYGQLGDNSGSTRTAPVAVYGLGSGVAAISAGSDHACAVTTGGATWCWGRNESGQLGDGTTSNRYKPVAVSGLGSGMATIAAGEAHTCAVTTGGAVSCWGANGSGQLGNDRALERLTPWPAVGFAPPNSDLTRDGRSDIAWRHATRGEIWLWPMNGAYRSSQEFLGLVGDTSWSIHGVADFTGDGKADLFWRNGSTGDLFLWTMNGTTITAQQYVGAVSLEYAIVGTADYNGDGKADLLWRHEATGALWMWEMNGAAPTAVTNIGNVPPAYAVVASGDVDGDGRADILWRNAANGEVWLWLLNGAASKSQTYLGSVADAHFRVVGLADHDRDGKADLLWWHETSGDVWTWRMNGAQVLAASHVATVGDTGYRVVGVGDYDGDGKADVLWHHATRGEVWVWLMNGGTIASQTWSSTVPDVGYQIVGPR